MGMPISVLVEMVKSTIRRNLAAKQHSAVVISVRPYHNHPKKLFFDVCEGSQGAIEIVVKRNGDKEIAVVAKASGCLKHFGRDLATLIANRLNRKPEQVET